MKNTCFILIFTVFFGCSSHKYKYNKYEIAESITFKFNETDSLLVNELRFTPNFTSTDLQHYLHKKYGKWTYRVKSNRNLDFLIWENIKLLDTSDELFTIVASGEDRKIELGKMNGVQKYVGIIYCSAIVFNSKNYDCFSSSSDLKNYLANSIINGTKSVEENDNLLE